MLAHRGARQYNIWYITKDKTRRRPAAGRPHRAWGPAILREMR
ncbi:hypothetical protein SUBVAR_04077 [Subdoligranulum variabile DSM 15176]|uniref:Uncharacterized protein n=1 Tax=Subdoligranulum variabile DSM 15176 TaxID=411471 RepID=D1PIB2_9FIRM|nr:hypothetical protein SUBVAR_04077 [Subdoligranulum variabile DSM 15176]